MASIGLDEVDWAQILPANVRSKASRNSTKKIPTANKVQLVVSLILYLKLPFAPLLLFLFESRDERIRQKAGNFLAVKESWAPAADTDGSDAMAYQAPAAKLYSLWHGWSASVRGMLHEHFVKPCALEIALEESDKGTQAKDFKLRINLSQLTMHDVREVLRPGNLLSRAMSFHI